MLKYLIMIYCIFSFLSCSQEDIKSKENTVGSIKNEDVIFDYSYDYLQYVYMNLEKLPFVDPDIYTFNNDSKINLEKITVTKDKHLHYIFPKNNVKEFEFKSHSFDSTDKKLNEESERKKQYFEIDENQFSDIEMEYDSLKLNNKFFNKLNIELKALDKMLEEDESEHAQLNPDYFVAQYIANLDYMTQITLFDKKYTYTSGDEKNLKHTNDRSYLQFQKIKQMIKEYIKKNK